MKNLPIKEEISNLLVKNFNYPGVWKIRTKEKYLKLASKITCPPVKINYEKPKNAVEAVWTCAKIYKRLVQEGLYSPQTQIVVCKDYEDNFTLLILMPKLKELASNRDFEKMRKKMKDLEKRLGMNLNVDLDFAFNWGYDEKTKECYAHDLHIVRKRMPTESYEEFLKIADKMGIK